MWEPSGRTKKKLGKRTPFYAITFCQGGEQRREKKKNNQTFKQWFYWYVSAFALPNGRQNKPLVRFFFCRGFWCRGKAFLQSDFFMVGSAGNWYHPPPKWAKLICWWNKVKACVFSFANLIQYLNIILKNLPDNISDFFSKGLIFFSMYNTVNAFYIISNIDTKN